MSEQFARVGDIDLCFETFGDAGDPTVLLVMGLGTQMIAWPVELCEMLVAEGLHVVRFDNRDIGHSTRLRGHAPPSTLELLTRRPRDPAYLLEDMARDAVGLLDHLGVERAHVTGASMGGMIAQAMAAHHGDRVASLVSVMSTTGNWRVGFAAPRVYPFLIARAAPTREAYLDRAVALFRLVGSREPTFPFDEARTRALAGESWDRGLSFAGTGRQIAAILASRDRTASLAGVTAPTLVVHGSADRLVHASGGRATAQAIPGASFELVEDMGHDLPRGVWPRLAAGITATAALADERRGAVVR